MNRRAFIQMVGTAALAGAALISTSPINSMAAALTANPARLDLKDKVLQAGDGGRLLESFDEGKTWHGLANFGSHCEVLALAERDGWIFARIGIQKFSFLLQSADGRTWFTTHGIPA